MTTVLVPINDEKENTNSYTELKEKKPYTVLKDLTYISDTKTHRVSIFGEESYVV